MERKRKRKCTAAVREAYIEYLQSNGYELIEETKTGDVIYAKGSHAVKVLKMTGKVSWNDEVTGQYGFMCSIIKLL